VPSGELMRWNTRLGEDFRAQSAAGSPVVVVHADEGPSPAPEAMPTERCAFANAKPKLVAPPITSPVEFISGPRNGCVDAGEEPHERKKTGIFTKADGDLGSSSTRARQRAQGHTWPATSRRDTRTAFEEITARCATARGLTLEDVHPDRPCGVLHVQ